MTQRVLIIDDDPDVRRILRRRLEHAGLVVGEASDGTEGLESLRRLEWDLILLDLVMPKMNGFDFLSEVRGLTAPPVVVITQLDDYECQERVLALGASELVPKRNALDRTFVGSLRKWLPKAA